ncbi:TaqI-like C-terminal specificity domain-containing protein [Helicobacter pylori]|uniref:TaqI-like C-terminal specificity domain-containing protein n=1 Tax=Helicobacter pylori TaxID=210 RepID=UPI0026C18A5C
MELNALKVFESAAVDTSIMNFIKQTPHKESEFKYYEPTPNDKNDLKNTPYLSMKQNALSTESFIFANATLLDLREKIESIGTPLKDWDIQIYRGILTGANEAFIITTEKRDAILNACKTQEERKRTERLIKPILRGKDIKRYSYEWAHLWVIATFPSLKLDIDDYPSLKTYLSQFRPRIDQSGEKDCRKKTNNQWFETQDTIAYHEDFEKEKIVWASVGFVEYCMIPGLLILDTNYFFEVSKFGNTKNYLLGLLNSKLLTFWLKAKNTPLGDMGAYRNYKYNIMELPMVKITAKNKKIADKIIALVDKILQIKEKDSKANTQQLEKEIDALVYQLYHLTDEEIKIIEDGQ